MRQRFISAGILVALIAAVVLLSLKFSIFIDIFVAFICAAAVFEFNKAVKTLHLYQMSFISIAFAFIYPMLLSYGMSTVICYIYVTMMLGVLVFFHSKISFKDTTDIINAWCIDVVDGQGTILGQYLYINCSSGNCDKYK